MDNVFIERLWRSLKHEDIYLKGYADGRESSVSRWYDDRSRTEPAEIPIKKTAQVVLLLGSTSHNSARSPWATLIVRFSWLCCGRRHCVPGGSLGIGWNHGLIFIPAW
jgi:hypothetical protein